MSIDNVPKIIRYSLVALAPNTSYTKLIMTSFDVVPYM